MISIICNINGTNKILLTKLTYNPYGEKLIIIDEMNKNAIKLSEVLNKETKIELESYQSALIRQELKDEQEIILKKTKSAFNKYQF